METNNNIVFRSFKEGDYETCRKWWKFWWGPHNAEPIRRGFLPSNERCYVIEKDGIPIASTFLILAYDIPAVAWTTYLVSNPKYREKDRKEAIELLITNAEDVCKNMGITYMFSIGRSKNLMKTHEKLGWQVDKKPSYEIIKNL